MRPRTTVQSSLGQKSITNGKFRLHRTISEGTTELMTKAPKESSRGAEAERLHANDLLCVWQQRRVSDDVVTIESKTDGMGMKITGDRLNPNHRSPSSIDPDWILRFHRFRSKTRDRQNTS